MMIHQLHRPALDRLKRIKRIEPWYRNQFCVATKCGLSRWYHFPNARFRFWPLSVDTEESPESCWENEVGRWALCLAESPLKRTGHGISSRAQEVCIIGDEFVLYGPDKGWLVGWSNCLNCHAWQENRKEPPAVTWLRRRFEFT